MTPDPMALDFSGLVVEEVTEDPGMVNGVTAMPYYGPPGSQGRCPDCGRSLKILKSGDLWAHKCVDGQMTTPTQTAPGGGPPASGGKDKDTPQPKRKGRTPPKVQTLWVALAGGTTEWTAREVASRNTGAPKGIIPVDIPDDDADQMLAPVMDAIWPRLPKGAQKAISGIAEEAGLILAAIMWADYIKTLNQWSADYRKTVQVQQAPRRPRSVPTPPAPQPQGAPNGFVQGQNGSEPHISTGYEPFHPAAG